MLSPQEITLQAALQEFGLRALPREWNPDGGSVMIDGIALVLKAGGVQEYCRVEHDGEKVYVTRDYGRCATIIAYQKIYAVHKLEKRFVPDLRSDRQIIEFLSKNGHDHDEIAAMLDKDGHATPEQAKASRDKVKKYINQAAVKIAKKTLAEEDRVRKIHSFANSQNNGTKAEES